MPVSFYVPSNDGICMPERALQYANQIGKLQNYFVFDGWGHGDPAGFRSDDYMNLLIAEVDGPILSAPRYMDQDPNNIVIPSGEDGVTPPSPEPIPDPVVPDDDTDIPDDGQVVPDEEVTPPSPGPKPDPVVPDEPIDLDKVYKEFAKKMNNDFPDCSWEPIEVITDDGYILTLFHIWIEGQTDDGLGPVMFQHGRGGYAPNFLNAMKETVYTFAHLGHHVYMGNNRGNKWSQGHVSLDMYEDAEEYWKFSWHEMAYDVFANVEAMYLSAGGVNKGYYFGVSQGSL